MKFYKPVGDTLRARHFHPDGYLRIQNVIPAQAGIQHWSSPLKVKAAAQLPGFPPARE